MKAITVINPGQDSKLVWEEAPDPKLSTGEVLIDVKATALNRADLLQRRGLYPPPEGASNILGLEAAGEIIEVHPSVTNWRSGDRVCVLLPGGGYATKVSAPEKLLIKIPEDWSYAEAAAFPEAFFTAYLNLFIEGDLKSNETVLIHGGASGIGTAAIQLAARCGAKVVVTASSEEKLEICSKLGAEFTINYKQDDFSEYLKSKKISPDIILDIVGGAYFEQNISSLNFNGRLVCIGLLGGEAASINLRKVLQKNLKIIGSTLRNKSLEDKTAIKNSLLQHFEKYFEDGSINPVIYDSFPIEKAEEAHKLMKENLNIGKIVLTMN